MDKLDKDDGFELTTLRAERLGLRFGLGFVSNFRRKYKRPRARLSVGRWTGQRPKYFSFYLTDPIRWCGQRPSKITPADIRALQRFINTNLPIILGHWYLRNDSAELCDGLKVSPK